VGEGPPAGQDYGDAAPPPTTVGTATTAAPQAPVEAPSAEEAQSYLYVVYSGATADEDGLLVTELTRRGIPISPAEAYDSDITSMDSEETAKIANAAAVLLIRTGNEDTGLLDNLNPFRDRLVVAAWEGSVPSLSGVPMVDLRDWRGDPFDERLDLLESILRSAMGVPLVASSRPQDAGGTQAPPAAQEAVRQPDAAPRVERGTVSGFRLSASAYSVLVRSTARAQGQEPSPTDVLLESLVFQPAQGGGIGTALMVLFMQRAQLGAATLINRVNPGLLRGPLPEGDVTTGPTLDALLRLAQQCAQRVSGPRVSGQPEIHLRHLLAAVALTDTGPVEPDVLTRLGISSTQLPALLLQALRGTRTGDSPQAWEELLAVHLAGGFDRDLVDPNGAIPRDTDALDHGTWAAMFASLIAAQATSIPISIGLFGEWGAGKSTFMGLLRGEIKRLCGQPGYVQDVVQIGFNAWHYADANLWASMGDEIFRALADELTPPEQAPPTVKAEAQRLRDEIADGLVASRDLKARAEQARQQRSRLTEEIRDAQESRRLTARKLAAAAVTTPETKRQLDTAWRQLGVEDEVAQGELLADEIDGIRRQGTALRALAGQRLTWVLAAACLLVLLVTLAGTVIPASWAGRVRDSSAVGTISLVLGSALVLARRASAGLSTLRSVAARAAATADAESDQVIKAARDKLRQAQAKEQAAEAELRQVSADIEELQRKLTGLGPGQRLYSFLAERAASGDYASQLGLISTIRKDFKHLVQVLGEQRKARADAQDMAGVKRVDRIVLYIDDLDRCRPQQVVEVLQAVHLLLALDLFVVVVGVDPRWLVQSLREQYPGILDVGPDGHGGTPARGRDSALAEAVPADYLQKIFNIPFALPAFRGDHMEHLVRRLAGAPAAPAASGPQPDATSRGPGAGPEQGAGSGGPGGPGVAASRQPQAQDTARAGTGSPAGQAPVGQSGPGAPATASQGAGADRDSAGTAAQDGAPPAVPQEADDAIVSAHRLTEDELRCLGGLGAFVRTPRDGKRLFNVYRLLRSARDLSPASAFLGGEYQAVAILLGMLNLDASVLARIIAAPPDPVAGVAGGLTGRPQGTGTWASFALDLTPALTAGPDPSEPDHLTWANNVTGAIPAAELDAWQRMSAAVTATTSLVTLPGLAAFQAWAPHVLRFSYLVFSRDR
jgi:hypothetical protein